jgi:hypothetical protein
MKAKKFLPSILLILALTLTCFSATTFAEKQVQTPKEHFTTYYVDGTIHTLKRNVALDVFNGKVSPKTLDSLLKLADYMKTQNSDVLVGVIKTGHSKYVKGTKRISWHYYGKAFDIYNTKMASTILPWVYNNRKMLGVNELIFDAKLIGKSSNAYNLKHGEPYSYGISTLKEHRNHIHISTN